MCIKARQVLWHLVKIINVLAQLLVDFLHNVRQTFGRRSIALRSGPRIWSSLELARLKRVLDSSIGAMSLEVAPFCFFELCLELEPHVCCREKRVRADAEEGRG